MSTSATANILAALEPCRAALEASSLRRLRAQSDLVAKRLEEHGWDFKSAFPYNAYSQTSVRLRQIARTLVVSIGPWEQAKDAQRAVAGFLEAFAAKMVEKSGGVANDVAYSGAADPFSNSVLTIDGVKWHTKCIINVSKLGKLFNQWPTRRVG